MHPGESALRRCADVTEQMHAVTDYGHARVVLSALDGEHVTTVDPPAVWTLRVVDLWRRAELIRRARPRG